VECHVDAEVENLGHEERANIYDEMEANADDNPESHVDENLAVVSHCWRGHVCGGLELNPQTSQM
jgi:hypothetical protein